MTEQTIKEGDVVQLKSGGPPMTVTGFLNGKANVRWFEGTKSNLDSIPVVALMLYEDPNLYFGAVDKQK